jgi:class 3 adenylate cyclase
VARLSARERAKLPDSAFAYIDSRGKRRLPIHDEAHVKNALARFDRVAFEDDAARERARTRLLNAAKKHNIVPIGFISGQLRAERKLAIEKERLDGQAWGAGAAGLPAGFVTIVLTDIEGSTGLLTHLGDAYEAVLDGVREVIRAAVVRAGGREVEVRADEFFAVFERAGPAIETAVAVQRELARRAWPDDLAVRIRIGIHSGDITLTDGGYIGLSVHTAARVCTAGHGGQIVISEETRASIEPPLDGISFRSLGLHELAGLPEAVLLHQVEADGLLTEFPSLR